VKAKSLVHRIKAKGGAMIREARLSDTKRVEVMEAQRAAFSRLGISFDSAVSKTESTFCDVGEQRTDTSMHYEVFSGISQIWSATRILEIGTATGQFTSFLAALFPQAFIHTWDLPSESFRDSSVDSYKRIQTGYGDQTSQSRSRLDGLKNVVQVRQDSTRLTFESELFDIVWVDGDHTFPVVAFDLINALRLVPVNGWICVDDIRPRDTGRGILGSQETYKTVKHLESIGLVSLTLIMKRLDAANMLLDSDLRKYVAVLRRLV